jgi:uncharacterized protein
MQIIDEIKGIIKETCLAETNPHGAGALTHHIPRVARCAKQLAERVGADREIVEIAAWLHDYASVLNEKWVEDHHIHGAKLAEELLRKLNYPEDKIKRVSHCVYAHRGSKPKAQKTIEAKVVASADGMAHIIDAYETLHYAYTEKKLSIDEGARWLTAKLERSWRKMMPEAHELIRDRYEAAKLFLNPALEKNNDLLYHKQ